MGTFTPVIQQDLAISHVELGSQRQAVNKGTSTVGIRACPNADCRGIVLVVMGGSKQVVALPPEVMDFDTTDVPEPIANSLAEAIKCHAAQCYKAAALMVRRILEEVCEDRAANGSNLKQRLESLAKIVIIPPELLKAADHLRLLGNDAAHVEARVYQSVGEEEVRLAINLTKELLKGVYQYKALLSALQKLQVPEV